MRITVVSAHYPPNFISGGTLQPQRIARGLLDRGHDVRVFAGHLDAARPALETWAEVDETGLPVHWVVTTPFMSWSDPLNHDNPAVAERFAAHLREHPADVVHLHALQTVGAGLLDVAKASGARVVVTMHDFWWVCARQFLVDTHDRPCALVVDAGACACEAGRAQLDERTQRLAGHLAAADLVLAPSRSAAAVLAANGVDPDRLRVDENGMETTTVAPRRAEARSGPTVVRYTGGGNAMKGALVLLEAAALLGPRDDLRLIAHGLAEAVDEPPPAGSSVLELVPPYGPDELDAVLADTDVLVLPSLIRESHSLVTREALLRGVPTIVTDTLGPEEVVDDGRNGLVVAAGDAQALADALAAVADPARLAVLQAGAREPIAVRSIEDQIDGLEARFAALVESAAAGPSAPPWTPRHVLFIVGIDGAPLRYRAQLPAEALALLGITSEIRHYRDPDLDEQAARADIVVVYRVPATPQVLALIERVRARGTRVAFDVDDLIFDPGIADEIPALRLLPADEARLWLEGVQRYRTTLEACDAYIGSTARLVEHERSVVGLPAHQLDNGVGCALGAASDRALAAPRTAGPPRVGYFSGTTTHDEDWRHIEAAVVDVLGEHPDVELWLGGHLRPSDDALAVLGDRVHRLPFVAWDELPARLRDLDVNLAPLGPGSRFNDAKSAIKWLEAALVGTPTIASPSQPFRDAIEPGVTGWLADDPEEWRAALRTALGDRPLRERVGARATRTALLRWSPHLQARRYLDVLRAIAAAPPRTAGSTWSPVANDEPALPVRTPLSPYPPEIAPLAGVTPPPAPSLPARLRTLARRARVRAHDDGVVAATAAGVRAIGRKVRARLGRG